MTWASSLCRVLLLNTTFLLCCFSLYCLMTAVVNGLRRAPFFLFSLFTLGAYGLHQLAVGLQESLNGLPLPSLYTVLLRLPAAWVFAAAMLLAGMEGCILGLLLRRQHRLPSPMSIRESTESLPAGLCFSTEDGHPLLVNRRMDSLCHAVTGRALLDGSLLWEALTKGESRGAGVLLQTSPQPMLRTPDGRVWSFSRSLLQTRLGSVYQLAAADVTEQYRVSQTLLEDNRKLRELNLRLRKYGETVSAAQREEEILNAKVRIHDDTGRALLAAKRCILLPSDREQRAAVLALWRRDNVLMRDAAEPETPPAGRIADLRAAAEAIGVRILLTGQLPPGGSPEEALAEAVIHECLTNAVRHGEGDTLWVEVREDRGCIRLSCTNNGRPPAGPITEGGGLSSLRRRLEKAGGAMETAASPVFRLTAHIPRNGGDCP